MAAEYGFPAADQMQDDIDQLGGGAGARGGPILPPPGMYQPDPAAMQDLMQQMIQQMMQTMMSSFQQAAQGMAASGSGPPTASSPVGGHWRQDNQMANVRLDERAFRRLEKFSNKKSFLISLLFISIFDG